MLETLEHLITALAAFLWGAPMVVLLVGSGVFFFGLSRLTPLRHLGHALAVTAGRYDSADAPGDIPHFQALSSALSGTLGLGNIAGVAVAIQIGGPGAVFWMWVTALVGTATKFFTCTLAVMYRGPDSLGRLQGGPMYVIREGLGARWRWLAIWFCIAGLFGTLPVFQANQLTQIMRDGVAAPAGYDSVAGLPFDFLFGLVLALLVATVIFGGITRIGRVAGRLVPMMVLVYLAAVTAILLRHLPELPALLGLILRDAFTGEAAAGGALGVVILTGVRRGAFSNEAGIGTEAMAHGAARTREPVREGLVAMLGPVIDTLLVCTATALAILATGVWRDTEATGVSLTAAAFESALPGGTWLLAAIVAAFSISTLLTYWYYGAKCLGFLVGAQHEGLYRYFYCLLIVVGAVTSLNLVIGLIDAAYALMAVPTLVSSLLLAPRVMAAARAYFARLPDGTGPGV